jgi:hypothetical protein
MQRIALRHELVIRTVLFALVVSLGLVVVDSDPAVAHCDPGTANNDVFYKERAALEQGYKEVVTPRDGHFDTVAEFVTYYNWCEYGHDHGVYWAPSSTPNYWRYVTNCMWLFAANDGDFNAAPYRFVTRCHWFKYDQPAGSGPCWSMDVIMWENSNHNGLSTPGTRYSTYYGRHRYEAQYYRAWQAPNYSWICNP